MQGAGLPAPKGACGQLLRYGYCKFSFMHATGRTSTPCNDELHVVLAADGHYYHVPDPATPRQSTNLDAPQITERLNLEHEEKRTQHERKEDIAVGTAACVACTGASSGIRALSATVRTQRDPDSALDLLDAAVRLTNTYEKGRALINKSKRRKL